MTYPDFSYTPQFDSPPLWWQTGIFYQVYPRSFQDSNADGIGDLAGLLARLNYLSDLGVRCLWVSPIYPSPMFDFGYDVANYTAIDPLFGNLNIFDVLLNAVHEKGMKLIMDWVPNHTSHLHPWFLESRRSIDSPKRDWYIWENPADDGGPPNNWISFFGGSAWKWEPTTSQYYLHQFVQEQPELNYRNPAVLEAMLAAMRFWLERGVDGFRVDVIWLLIKDAALRDEPLNSEWDGKNPHARLQHLYTANQPEVHEVIRRFRALLDEYPERVMVGEIDLPFSELMAYYGYEGNECDLPTNFSLIHTPWRAADIGSAIGGYLNQIPPGGWPNWVLGNHDQHRLASRLGQAQARVATLLLLTLPGTPTCYYGDEIGLENGVIPTHKIRDPQAVNQPEVAETMGRDPERTPMQWDDSPNAGFTAAEVEPWLPVSEDYPFRNALTQRESPDSFLSFFSSLSQLRRHIPALTLGSCHSVNSGDDAVLAYTRFLNDETYLILLNFSAEALTLNLDLGDMRQEGQWILSTRTQKVGRMNLNLLKIAPDEGCIIRLYK